MASKGRSRGQAAPDSDRTREIQMALVREHYLNGEPSGAWDAETRNALTRFQADHGWQSKVVPDSRALIKLGLGPSREGLLNPDTAAISPHELGAEHPQPGGSSSN
ncbi:MAG TPA: peptidoglycan-binding domain-containing protein [Gemmatimonadaceae bacterium]